jgi:excisionase family DNA binding protein
MSTKTSAAIQSPSHSKSSPATIDPTEILTLDEVAARLKVSPRYIYEKTRARSRNPIPCLRPGRVLRFLWGDVCVWLRSQSSGIAA